MSLLRVGSTLLLPCWYCRWAVRRRRSYRQRRSVLIQMTRCRAGCQAAVQSSRSWRASTRRPTDTGDCEHRRTLSQTHGLPPSDKTLSIRGVDDSWRSPMPLRRRKTWTEWRRATPKSWCGWLMTSFHAHLPYYYSTQKLSAHIKSRITSII